MSDPICPFLNKPCIQHQCMMYTHVTMVANPQTGASQDTWGCAIAWLPVMQIESARQTRNVAASVDSMRNEVVKRQDELNAAVAIGVNHEMPTPALSLPDSVRDCGPAIGLSPDAQINCED